MLAEEAPEHFEKVLDDFIQVQGLDLQDRAAAEQEELAGEVGRAFGMGFQVSQRSAGILVQARISVKNAQVHHDRGNDIIEIVGDAAGELANALHLLGLAQ